MKANTKSETQLCAALIRDARDEMPAAVILNIADRWNSGYPDVSIDQSFVHVWLELKLADPDFKSKGVQELTMVRLSRCAFAYYVIYDAGEKGSTELATYIVVPHALADWRTKFVEKHDGFAHDKVVAFVKRIVGEELRRRGDSD